MSESPEPPGDDLARELRAEIALARAAWASARVLAAGADRDVSEVRAELRSHTRVLTAVRETQVEQGQAIAELRTEVRAGFAEVRTELAEMRTGFATLASGMADITTLLHRAIGDWGHRRASAATSSRNCRPRGVERRSSRSSTPRTTGEGATTVDVRRRSDEGEVP